MKQVRLFQPTRIIPFVVALCLILFAAPAFAQDLPPLPGELVVGDLPAPRGIAFDAAGNLIVAVAGAGGDITLTLPGPDGEAEMSLGLTGRVVSVAPDGMASDWIPGFPSYATATETVGLYRAIPQNDSLWIVFNGSGAAATGAYWMDSVVELDAASLRVKRVINLNAIEAELDPDGAGFDTNVSDIAWAADGTLYITNAGGNDLLSWTEEGGLQVVHAWTDNPVPTSVEVAENGDLYVGFLGAGIAPGAGKVEHWSNGELVETFGGLTGVTDILLDGDTLYAVQLFLIGEQGPGPGNVVMLSADGATPVAEGLITPFALGKGPDGAIYVSYGTIAFAPGMMGGVVKLSGM
ncbi:MAG: ScyD/ScyE family protein [Chloroflexi bacterium]|nr:ScyD/ScyE family protein [Chloroflexota bacterium]